MISFNKNKEVYVLHNKALCLIKVIKVLLNIKEQLVTYVTELGNYTRVYNTIEDYKKDITSDNTTLKSYYNINGLNPKNNTLYTFENNNCIEVNVKDLLIEYCPDTNVFRYVFNKPLYNSREECFANNDIAICETGVITMKPCLKSKLSLTEEQKVLVETLKHAWRDCLNNGITIYHDDDYSELYALNNSKIKEFSASGDLNGNNFVYKSIFTPLNLVTNWISFDNYTPNVILKENE